MNQALYERMTTATRRIIHHLPSGEAVLRIPTLICGCFYLGYALRLLLLHDRILIPYCIVPAVCFISVSILRQMINRTRPYDVFQIPPVGKHIPKKGKSMPSRHAASAVAILMAVLFLSPGLPVSIFMVFITLLICLLRIVTGQHYPSDVVAGALFSILLSFLLFPPLRSLTI